MDHGKCPCAVWIYDPLEDSSDLALVTWLLEERRENRSALNFHKAAFFGELLSHMSGTRQ